MNYELVKLFIGVVCTVALYSVLYRENKFYRLFEHIFVGLAAGYAMVALWTDTLKGSWWDKMVGSHAEGNVALTNQPGYWAYMLLLPIGLLGYFVYSKKHNWLSRIPIGIILGLWSGQQLNAFLGEFGPQIAGSIKPLLPTTFTFAKPETAGLDKVAVGNINSFVYVSQAINNILFTFTLLSVLAYFLYSFDAKHRLVRTMSTSGRWLLMIGFGAIFGSTVMTRFALLIDRMSYIWIEFFKHTVFHK